MPSAALAVKTRETRVRDQVSLASAAPNLEAAASSIQLVRADESGGPSSAERLVDKLRHLLRIRSTQISARQARGTWKASAMKFLRRGRVGLDPEGGDDFAAGHADIPNFHVRNIDT
jgi:uncharacterized protein with PIN domain